ncbi:hypothetical protein FA15DRAFT_632387 [Coprinopsis marcescibilis]|uniref:BRCT domain-containing protein n=1 Tax=Coprinopsis marcescibilis TaxID=230819 RepID=A0A5C3L969_COPMA|nr:hypothetical protein FA15DRAFT_632387 [Coprinopsis marcescibilis]
MERYFPVVKRSLAGTPTAGNKECGPSTSQASQSSRAAQPGTNLKDAMGSQAISKFRACESSREVLNQVLLQTLGSKSNPITHSDIVERSDVVVSTSTGHQVSDGGNLARKQYFARRESKLRLQQAGSSSEIPQIFANLRIYINGYLEDTTDIEIKRLIAESGGKVVSTSSRCTHIVTSSGLSGSKSQKYLRAKSHIPYIVKPAWVIESHGSGKRRSEAPYSVKVDRSTRGPEVVGGI